MNTSGGLSLTHLFSTLMADISLLFRKEIELARTEIKQKVADIGSGAIYMVVGGLLAWAALMVLLAAAVLGLMLVLPGWASALIVGGGVLLVALGLLIGGYARIRATHLKPERTVRTLRDDAAFARQQLRGG